MKLNSSDLILFLSVFLFLPLISFYSYLFPFFPFYLYEAIFLISKLLFPYYF